MALRATIQKRLNVTSWFDALLHDDFVGATQDDEPTETEAVAAAEKPADGEEEPGSVQAASEAGFETEVAEEAKADT